MNISIKTFNIKRPFFYTLLFVLSWIYSAKFNSADYDLWARLAVGKIYFQLGHLLNHDIFSFTPTNNLWIDHEWGSGVVFYFINQVFGTLGLFVFKTICVFLILFFISKAIEERLTDKYKNMNVGMYFLAYIGMSYGIMAIIRCQLFTFIFFALWIYTLERVRKGENRLLWIFPATMLIWANLHGGFVAGIGLLLIYGVGEFLNKKPSKKYFAIAIPTMLITLINPYGFKYLEFIFHATTMSRSTIQEWHAVPLNDGFATWKGFKIYLIFSAIGLVSSFIRTKLKYNNIDKVKYLLIFVTLYLSLSHIKHMPLYVIAASIFLYQDFYAIFGFLGNLLIKISGKFNNITKLIIKYLTKIKEFAIYSLILFTGAVLIPTSPHLPFVSPLKYPVLSVEFIKENHLSGNILTLFHWGSYSIWELYPNNYLAEDGRYEEVYSQKLHMDVYKFNYMYNRFIKSFINHYHTDIIIVEKVNLTYPEMLKNPEWTQVYQDFVSAVFIPTNKLKKNYVQPKLTSDMIYKDKYVTSIDFLH